MNFDRLSPLAQEAAREAGLAPACTNPFRSIVVRAVEVLYACDEALRIIDAYEEPDQPVVAVTPRAGTGYAAPRRLAASCITAIGLDEDGTIADARSCRRRRRTSRVSRTI